MVIVASNQLVFLIISTIFTLLCLLLTLRSFRHRKPTTYPATASSAMKEASSTPLSNGIANFVLGEPVLTNIAEDSAGGPSMMEQLVPEITTHALSYLDYPSLCRLSMTSSLMRKAANDDNAWKALYHKDFTLKQDGITPANGWKGYYAATRKIVNVNAEFFNIIRERSLTGMRHSWLNADYVKCIHGSGEVFSGYSSVLQSWQLAFNWEQGIDFHILDVRARVLTDMAWVNMKAYLDLDGVPFHVTNVFEFHRGRWYIVHHHCSVDVAGRQIAQG